MKKCRVFTNFMCFSFSNFSHEIAVDKSKVVHNRHNFTNFFYAFSTVFKNHRKVAFNIASEANYVYILKPETVLPDRSNWWIIPKLN